MALKLSPRSDIPAFRALDILRLVNERVAQGADIIRLEAGQPCHGAPLSALEYARTIVQTDPRQGYTEALGMRPLRERIAQWYGTAYNLDLDPNRVAVTMGASGAFILAFMSVFSAGDRVAMGIPCYPPYRNILRMFGVEVIEIDTTAATNYQPTLAQIAALEGKIDGLLIASPGNPAGTIIPEADLKAIANWCDAHQVRLISDELFQKVTYGDKAETVLRFTDNAVVANSFSKYFAMTGWRLGWLVLPEDVLNRVKCLAESMFVSPPTLAQHVAYKVFDHIEDLDGYVAHYGENLTILKRELPKAGFTKLSDTRGTFYLYVDVSDLTNDSIAFCRQMLDEARVSCTPGVDFDEKHGLQTIRISFGGKTEDIIEACERLKSWHQTRKAA